MKNILNKKLNKKGFTLAELLIVVAIIAILVAIAMPLFFGALDRAEKATEEANIRAVRAIAVNEVLGNWEKYSTLSDDSAAKYWRVTATIDENGNVTVSQIIPANSQTGNTDFAPANAKKAGNVWTVKLELSEVEVTGA